MSYTDGFTSVRNGFIVSPAFDMDEKIVLIWLASKPADWNVRLEQVQSELGLGRDRVKRILRNLRAKGAITKPEPERQKDGTFRRAPGRLTLAARSSIRHVSAGRTEGLETKHSVPGPIYKGSRQTSVTSPAEPGPDVTSSSPLSAPPPHSSHRGKERSDLWPTPRSSSPILTLDELIATGHNTGGFRCPVCGTDPCRENSRRIMAERNARDVA